MSSMIESRYTIEYVVPDKKKKAKTSSKPWLFLLIPLIALSAGGYMFYTSADKLPIQLSAFLPKNNSTTANFKDFIISMNNKSIASKKATEPEINELKEQHSVTLASNKQLEAEKIQAIELNKNLVIEKAQAMEKTKTVQAENIELKKTIEELSASLKSEKNTIAALQQKLDKTLAENAVLDDKIRNTTQIVKTNTNIKTKDTKKTVSNTQTESSSNTKTALLKETTKVEKTVEKSFEETTPENNNVLSQMDSIVATMQNEKNQSLKESE